ncbi:unnamed protein product, partial [Prorocentrum cordatum]
WSRLIQNSEQQNKAIYDHRKRRGRARPRLRTVRHEGTRGRGGRTEGNEHGGRRQRPRRRTRRTRRRTRRRAESRMRSERVTDCAREGPDDFCCPSTRAAAATARPGLLGHRAPRRATS